MGHTPIIQHLRGLGRRVMINSRPAWRTECILGQLELVGPCFNTTKQNLSSDNYYSYRGTKGRTWLARHPRGLTRWYW